MCCAVFVYYVYFVVGNVVAIIVAGDCAGVVIQSTQHFVIITCTIPHAVYREVGTHDADTHTT